MIFLSPFPAQDHFVDEVVTGQVQYIDAIDVEEILINSLQKALDWVSSDGATSYRMRFFAPGDVIIREGEKGDFVYLVKTGHLKAFRMDGPKEVSLGEIMPGEFVGALHFYRQKSLRELTLEAFLFLRYAVYCLSCVKRVLCVKDLPEILIRRLKVTSIISFLVQILSESSNCKAPKFNTV